MAKTIKDIDGNIIELVEYETYVDVNRDLISGAISNYFVVVLDSRYEVNEETYEAVKKYIEWLYQYLASSGEKAFPLAKLPGRLRFLSKFTIR